MEESELIERYLILLLGVNDNPVPSDIHLQKELFILSNTKELLKDKLNFQKHYFGPFSQILEETLRNPTYFSESFDFDNKKVFLTKSGKSQFEKMILNFSKSEEFKSTLTALKMIRQFYERFSKEELLFIIYETYPEFTSLSSVSDKLTRDNQTRTRILKNILFKGLITPERYEELKNARD